jgi:small-conductance mechanosensitive channel
MNGLLQQAGSLSLFAKCVAAVIGIVFIYGTFRVMEQTLPQRFGRADARYKVRKFIVFSGYLTLLVFLGLLFEDRLGRLSFAIGAVGAGVAVALQDVLASIAGAFSIGFSTLYTVGDRVQIGDTRGDVIDIGLLRTTLMETGNWVRKDLYNGRLVRIPNSTVLKGTVFNYSQGFQFIWDEIKVQFTNTSDCQFAREMLLRLAKESIGDYLIEAQVSWKHISDNFRIANSSLEPIVTLVVNNALLEFGLSYVVDYTKRTAKQDELFTKIVEEVAKSNGRLQWASPTTTTTVNVQPTSTGQAMPSTAPASQPSSSPRAAGQAPDSR